MSTLNCILLVSFSYCYLLSFFSDLFILFYVCECVVCMCIWETCAFLMPCRVGRKDQIPRNYI
ncbi:mCG148314 [Mus musculus]|nr:mCG148314 [Mus musculus]